MSAFVLLLDWEGFERDKYVHTVLEDNLLPNFLENCSWFDTKGSKNWRIKITGAVRMQGEENEFFFVYLQIKYSDGSQKTYLLPVAFIADNSVEVPETAIISKASLDEKEGYLVEAIYDPAFRMSIYKNTVNGASTKQKNETVLQFENAPGLESNVENSRLDLDVKNSALIFDDKYFFKFYRTVYEGISPELEILRFLSKNDNFNSHPKYYGSLNLMEGGFTLHTFGVLIEYVGDAKDNWSLTGDYLNDFIGGLALGNFQVKEEVFVKVAKLGKKTAIMHEALFDLNSDAAFRPVQIDRSYRRDVHRNLEDLLDKRYDDLIERYLSFDEDTQALAWQFMEAKDKILNFIDQILTRTFTSLRIRVHGDFHLGQILANENGYSIIDFEGEPDVSIKERIVKHSPLKDVASMIRSYHYAVSAKLYNSEETKDIPDRDLRRASDRWYKLMRDTFLEEYLNYFGPHHTLLKNNNEVNYLLQFHLLEKAIKELAYEVNNRPTWVKIPLKGILDVIKEIEKLRTN